MRGFFHNTSVLTGFFAGVAFIFVGLKYANLNVPSWVIMLVGIVFMLNAGMNAAGK